MHNGHRHIRMINKTIAETLPFLVTKLIYIEGSWNTKHSHASNFLSLTFPLQPTLLYYSSLCCEYPTFSNTQPFVFVCFIIQSFYFIFSLPGDTLPGCCVDLTQEPINHPQYLSSCHFTLHIRKKTKRKKSIFIVTE